MTRFATIALVTLAAGCATAEVPQLVAGDLERLLVVPAPVRMSAEAYPANLIESLLAYYGAQLDPEAMPGGPHAAAITGDEMREVLENHGLTAFLLHGTIGNGPLGLGAQLTRARPPMALVEDDQGAQRWLLVVGHDEARRIVVIQDPLARLHALPRDSFERHWARTKNLMIVAGAGRIP